MVSITIHFSAHSDITKWVSTFNRLSVSSGTHKTDGMIVIPCSMKTLSSIANGYDETLVARAAGVALKESRKLILVVRETPLTAINLENMLKLARLGVVMMPPVTEFYTKPKGIDDMVNHIVGKCFCLLYTSPSPRDQRGSRMPSSA